MFINEMGFSYYLKMCLQILIYGGDIDMERVHWKIITVHKRREHATPLKDMGSTRYSQEAKARARGKARKGETLELASLNNVGRLWT